jgi:hypothetical protein
MPAFLVVMEVHRAAEFRFDLDARDIGLDHLASTGAHLFAQSPEGRDDRGGGVSSHSVAAIVEIQGVRSGSVDEGRIEDGGAIPRAEERRRAIRADGGRPEHCQHAMLPRSGQRHADRIQHRHPRSRAGRGGDLVDVDAEGALGEVVQEHAADP